MPWTGLVLCCLITSETLLCTILLSQIALRWLIHGNTKLATPSLLSMPRNNGTYSGYRSTKTDAKSSPTTQRQHEMLCPVFFTFPCMDIRPRCFHICSSKWVIQKCIAYLTHTSLAAQNNNSMAIHWKMNTITKAAHVNQSNYNFMANVWLIWTQMLSTSTAKQTSQWNLVCKLSMLSSRIVPNCLPTSQRDWHQTITNNPMQY